jgi:hypothetical protein
LLEARYLIDKLLGEREDILKAMIKSGCRFMVMAPTEMTTDVPEQRHLKNDPKTNWDTRARGLGGKLSSSADAQTRRHDAEKNAGVSFGFVEHGGYRLCSSNGVGTRRVPDRISPGCVRGARRRCTWERLKSWSSKGTRTW